MGFKKSFMKNVAVFGSYTYMSLFFEFLSTIILSRLLVPEEYGFVAIILVFSGFIDLFTRAGLSQAVIRTNYGEKFFKLVNNVSLWIGIILTLILALLAYPISLFYSDSKLILATLVMSLSFVGNTISIVPNAILLKKLEFNLVGRYKLISSAISILLMIGFAYFGFSYWSLIIPTVIRPFINYLLLEIKLRFGLHLYGWKLTKFSISQVRDLLQTFTVFNVINYWTLNLDNFLIGKFYGNYDLGIYNRAYRFLRLGVKLINSIFGYVLLPSLKSEIEEKREYKKNFLDILDVVHLAGVLFSIALVIFPKFIVTFLWGENWIEVAKYMPYFGAIIPLQTLIIACDDLYVLENKEKAILSVGIPAAIILIASIVVGVLFSALDVARSFTIAFVIMQVPFHISYGHYKVLKFPKKMLINFWVPKIVFVFLVLISIWFAPPYATQALYGVYLVYLVFGHWNNFKKIISMIKNRKKKLKINKQ